MTPYSMEAAEAELRAALDSGDLARINVAAAEVDALDEAIRRQKPSVTLHQAALWYVDMGLRVFPLGQGSKIPFKGSRGCLDATNDAGRINDWWTATPDANIGLATGHLVDVVDIDGPGGQKSRAQHWDQIFAAIEADQVAKVSTPRPGGMHIWVPATGEGNSTNIVPSVDYRGLGGYVVAPPSVIAPGGKDHPGTYRFLGEPRLAPASEAA